MAWYYAQFMFSRDGNKNSALVRGIKLLCSTVTVVQNKINSSNFIAMLSGIPSSNLLLLIKTIQFICVLPVGVIHSLNIYLFSRNDRLILNEPVIEDCGFVYECIA